MKNSLPLPAVPQPASIPLDLGLAGPPISSLKRLAMMSAAEWEEFVLEWAHSLAPHYVEVRKCGAAGDLGVDIEAIIVSDGDWDAYQCKHYEKPLAPTDVYAELGKLCYYSFRGDYKVPRRYFLAAPCGLGNKLARLIRRPEELRDKLIEHWESHCAKKITSTAVIPLEGALLAWVRGFDFSRISSLTPLTLIDQHRKTPHHVARFGGGLPPRPPVPDPPGSLAAKEAVYVRALLDAYEERLGTAILEPTQLADPDLASHFGRSRREFYHAESLLAFSRENVPHGTYDALLDDVESGVQDVIEATHVDGVERVRKTVAHAKLLPLASSILVQRLTNSDKGGMCHQLANERGVRWKR